MTFDRCSTWLLRMTLLAALGSVAPACSDCDLSVSTGTLPAGFVGVRYSKQLDSDCGGDAWFIQTGDLPPGIGLQEDGDLLGTPTTVGAFTFTVTCNVTPTGCDVQNPIP